VVAALNLAFTLGGVTHQTNIAGIPQEQLEELVRPYRQLTETQEKLITRLEAELDLNYRQIRAALDILNEKNIPAERLGAKLIEIAEQFKALRSIALVQPGDDLKVSALKAEALKAVDDGKLDEADKLLSEIEKQQRRDLNRLAVNTADTYAQRGRIARAQLRYREAAKHFANAAAVLPPGSAHKDVRLGYLKSEAAILYHQGDEFGDNDALRSAVTRYKRLITLAPRKRAPLDWAMAQNNLGNALTALGERETGTARLEEAIAAFRAALTEVTRQQAPREWAVIQNNLGYTLEKLGDRETETARLDEAIVAFRAALTEITRQQAPSDWAAIQNNLSGVLRVLGERENDSDRLEQAVTASREALSELTGEPLEWARAQTSLGTALQALGQRETGTARLEQSVAAYRHALEQRTRKRVPLEWASTQNNLGNALWALGERETGTARLKEAVTAYQEALSEFTRERAPLQWAATQNNLGVALADIGERESGKPRLEEAVAAYREALMERTLKRVPLDWAITQNNLGKVLAKLGERESGTKHLEEAVAAWEACLTVVSSVWPSEGVDPIRSRCDATRAEIARRRAMY
jgi:tetratricopeptide (TPR) repeat protein